MGTYIHVIISADVTDKQKRLLKRIFILPEEPTDTQIHYLNHDLFIGYELNLNDLENGLLYMIQDQGPDINELEITELSDILGDTELIVKTYDEGSGDLDEVPEYTTWIDGKKYSEEDMYRNKMKDYLVDPTITGIITRHQPVINGKWSTEQIDKLVEDILTFYKPI
jgi:hypothetical protein